MSRIFERVDRETLLRDEQLKDVLLKIREKLKTLSSEIDRMSRDEKQLVPITGRTELDGLITNPERENAALLDQSFSKQIQGPLNTLTQLNQHQQSRSESEFSHQSFYSDEEPWNIDYINNNLDSVERSLNCENSSSVVIALKALFEQIRLLFIKNVNKKEFTHKYIVLALRCLYILGNAMKAQGNYQHAILYYENCLTKFIINEPTFRGKLLIEAGKACFISKNFQKSQQYYYDALLHYEQLNWRLDIAYVLTLLSRLNGWMKNPDAASKLCYESLAIYRDYLPEEDERIADTYFILAELAYLRKDFDAAFQFAEQSLQIHEAKNNKESYGTNQELKPQLSPIYNLLGILYANTNDYKQAQKYFHNAFQCGKQETLKAAQILMNWGIMQALECNSELAQKGILKAKQISQAFKNNSDWSQRLDRNYQELLQ
ncbi:unnamed protein product [Paramecium octaurelia]|uniref:Tetratricopeptide repeat protein n=1 Tax=Paramecium octaurelia TaxID=43137 RepID=A0A8S1X5G2_PAROT|nr:unnamed protein product [Paramecium octaurelia]